MAQQVLYRTREMQRLEAERGRPIDVLLRDMYEIRGLTLDEIARDLGLSKSAVSRWLERCGIETRRGRRR
jgi:DNA-binding transcriptional regulator LsrR (DeoR family)